MTNAMLTLAVLATTVSSSIALAAPPTYEAYCLVLSRATNGGSTRPPQGAVNLPLGSTKEIGRVGDLVFSVEYPDILGRANVVQLKMRNTQTNKQNLVDVTVGASNAFPEQIDLIVDEGGLSCFQFSDAKSAKD